MKPVVVGCRVTDFPEAQLAVFREHQPFGLIVFAEPAKEGPKALRHVIRQFRSMCPRAKIFIDAEGGRVNRLKPEFGYGWRSVPDARSFTEAAAGNVAAATAAIFANARLIAQDLRSLDIDVNCAPVADLVRDEALVAQDDGRPHATSASLHRRSFGADPAWVTACARAFMEGLESLGVCAVVKHVPGYGRVSADPHYAQTGIETPLEELAQTDFLPFKNLRHARAMMTGHVLYQHIDAERCSTLSPAIIDIIRQDIGFNGALVADTVEMNSIWPPGFSTTDRDQFGMGLPLPGTLTHVTRAVLAAGCDLVMHSDCSRDFAHTVEVLEAAPVLSDMAADWLVERMTVR
jgi:beta-N-acetylhexosaminidase